MKKLLAIALLPLMLVSCGGKNTGDTNLGKIKNDKMVLRTASDQFFSSSLKYSCTTADCNENVALVAIKNKKELNTCTGTQVSPSEVLVASTCFTRDLEELNRACDQKIEVHDVDGKIAKCQKVTNKYTNSLGDSIYKISLNADLRDVAEVKFGEIEKGNTYVESISFSTKDNNIFQIKTKCELTYNSHSTPSAFNNKSDVLVIKNCTLQNYILFDDNSIIGFGNNQRAINSLCLNTKCNYKKTNLDKALRLLNNSSNRRHKSLKRFMGKHIESNSQYDYSPKVSLINSQLVFEKGILCIRDINTSISIMNLNLPISINKDGELYLEKNVIRSYKRITNINLTIPQVRRTEGSIRYIDIVNHKFTNDYYFYDIKDLNQKEVVINDIVILPSGFRESRKLKSCSK